MITKRKGEVNMTDISADFEQNMFMKNFSKTDDIVNDMRKIIETSRDTAYKTVNTILLQRNWLIGYRIAEEGFLGADRAEYGANRGGYFWRIC